MREKKAQKEFRRFGRFAAFTLPAAACLTFTCLIPFLMNACYSFTKWNGVSREVKWIGLENYIEIFTDDPQFFEAAGFTFLHTVCFVAAVNFAAFAMAVLLTQKIRFRGALRACFFVPNTFSLVIVGFMWTFLFSTGFRRLYELTGLEVFGMPWLGEPFWAFWAILLVSVWQGLGYYMVIYIAGIQMVPEELLESAQMDGAGFLRQIRHVYLPMLRPTLSICVFLALSNGVKVFDVIFTLTKGGPGTSTNSLTMNIYNEAYNFNRYGYGTAKAVLFFAVIAAVSLLQQRIFRRRGEL